MFTFFICTIRQFFIRRKKKIFCDMQSYHSIQLDEDIYSLIQFCSLFEWFDYENIFFFIEKCEKWEKTWNIWIFNYLNNIEEKRVNCKVVTSSLRLYNNYNNVNILIKNFIKGISHASCIKIIVSINTKYLVSIAL